MSGENPNPGESRKTAIARNRQPTLQELEDAENFWRKYAPDVARELYDAEIATEDEQAEIDVTAIQ
jgi:hypothetical protein